MDLTWPLRESISRTCAVPAAGIQPDSELAELGVDSLAAAEILTDLEIRLGKQLPVDALRRLNQARTVGELESLLGREFVDPMPASEH
jgi:acyl carrier protein